MIRSEEVREEVPSEGAGSPTGEESLFVAVLALRFRFRFFVGTGVESAIGVSGGIC
jgi:hypothetical protein